MIQLSQIRTELDKLHDDAMHALHIERHGRPQTLASENLELGEPREKIEPVLLQRAGQPDLASTDKARTRLKWP
jgi:hypothetical protein